MRLLSLEAFKMSHYSGWSTKSSPWSWTRILLHLQSHFLKIINLIILCSSLLLAFSLIPLDFRIFYHIHHWETSRGNQGLNSPQPWGTSRNRASDRVKQFSTLLDLFISCSSHAFCKWPTNSQRERGMRDAKVSLQRLLHPSSPLESPHFLWSVSHPHRAGRKQGRSRANTECSKCLALKSRDLRSVVAQPLMVRVGNPWQATSSLNTFYLVFRAVLWVTWAPNLPSSSIVYKSSGCFLHCTPSCFAFIFKEHFP